MAIRLSTELVNRMLNATGLKGALDTGFICIYSGAQPASADAAATGTPLAVIYSDGLTATTGISFDAPLLNVLSKAAGETWSGTTLATGTAGWFRFYELDTNAATSKTSGEADDTISQTNSRLDGSVGTSGADLNISSTSLTAAALQTISTFTVTFPQS